MGASPASGVEWSMNSLPLKAVFNRCRRRAENRAAYFVHDNKDACTRVARKG